MEDAFALAADDNSRSQNSQRSKTRSWDGCRNSSEIPSSRRDPRDGRGGKTPYEGGDKITTRGTRKTFTLGTKGPTMNIPRLTNENKTVIIGQTVLLCTISNDCMAPYWGPRGAYVMS